MTVWRIAAGRLGQSGKNGTFCQGQLLDILVEVVFRCGFHSVCSVTEINLVQIEVKDLLLGQGFFHPPGQDGFFEFSGKGPFRGQQQFFCHLLGDGTAALCNPTGFDIF